MPHLFCFEVVGGDLAATTDEHARLDGNTMPRKANRRAGGAGAAR